MPNLKEDLEKKKKKPFYSPSTSHKYTTNPVDSLKEGARDAAGAFIKYNPIIQGSKLVPSALMKGSKYLLENAPSGSAMANMSPEEKKAYLAQAGAEHSSSGKEALTSPEERLKDKDKIAEMMASVEEGAEGGEEGKEGGSSDADEPKMPTYKAPDPAPYFNSRIKEVEEKLEKLPEERQSTWEAEVRRTKEWAQEAKDSLDKRELAEKLTQAIGQLAAGWYGLKHGMDMSGLEFNSTDWQAKLADMRGEQRLKLAEADKRESLRRQDAGDLKQERRSLQSNLEALKGRLAGEQFQGERDEANRRFQVQMAQWQDRMRALAEARKAAAGGYLKPTEVRALKKSEAEKAEKLNEAISLIDDDEDEKALSIVRSMYPDTNPEAKAFMEELDSWWVDEDFAKQFLQNELRLATGLSKQFDQLEKQSAGLGGGAASEPTVRVRGSNGAEHTIPKSKLEEAKRRDPKLTIIGQ